MIARLAAGIGLLALALTSTTALGGTLEGPLQIVVSKDLQSLKVYDGDVVVATSNVSTGKAGHSTPTGIFSILEKKRTHFSNLYDSAPMPFMQRLTWSGIALHASNSVPAYPASHGCVRLPNDFARMLFGLTRRGGHVVVSNEEVAPRPVNHAFLFQPATPPEEKQLLSDADLRPVMPDASDGAVEVAMNDPKPATVEPAVETVPLDPIRILITRRGHRETVIDLQVMLTGLGYDAGEADGLAGKQTFAAIRAFQAAEGLTEDGMLTPELVAAVYAKAGKGTPPNGQILVRRKFQQILESPVTIAEPEKALGAQFLIARQADDKAGAVAWYGLTLENHLTDATMKRLGVTSNAETGDTALAETLDRITIPDDIRTQIAAMTGEGASLSISDTGLGPETGKGTDFITVTKKAPMKVEAKAVTALKKRKNREKAVVRIE